jgi:hypothetical protein
MTKTGNRGFFGFIASALLLFSLNAHATVQATVDRSEVPLDESVSLKISASGDASTLNPKFEAPDFEIMNQFQNSQFSSVYVNGKFENKSENSITYILRPKKLGSLRIHNISNNGEKAPDLTVQVIQETLYKKQAGGEAPSLQGDAKMFFVKADTSKSRVYQGEQIIISYYLYRRTRANVRDVMQYPSFQGFIREDLEMPILSGRPDFEAVNLGGIPFERALLARYAVYPIKDGKLKIDGFSVRVDYVPRNTANEDMMEDPFFQFFTQVTPRTASSKSDPITIDVLPLPEEGKTSQFTGGVGNFDVTATLDNTALKANSPVTLRVNVRGKGNTSLVEFPTVNWPKEIKLYETQGKSKNLGQGNSEKTFEVVLVPLQKGALEVPPIEFEFFDPESRTYVRKKTAAIPIQVAEGDPGSAPSFVSKPAEDEPAASPGASANSNYGSLRLKDKRLDGTASFLGQPWWRWVAWFGLAVFFSFLALVVYDQAKKRSMVQLEILKRKQNLESFWKNLEKELSKVGKSPNFSAYSPILEKIEDELYKSLDSAFGIASRAMANRDLANTLTESHGVSREDAKEVTRIREYTEMVRFSSSGGTIAGEDAEREVQNLIQNAKRLCLDFSGRKAG